MARLQKKISPEAKKKKKIKADTAEDGQGNEAEAKKGKPFSGASRDTTKKVVSTTKKADGSPRATLMAKKPNFVNQSVQFLREVKVELKKVAWPTRKQTIGSTVVVIVLVMIVSLFLGVVDFGLNNLIRVVLQ
ncbi:MAG: preprotein translocase subunit SecE [Desulfobacterales bacterium]|nr:preprotein translocase subunit SecE [Desulfobacterales bacterium]